MHTWVVPALVVLLCVGCGNSNNSGTGFELRPMSGGGVNTIGTYNTAVLAESDPILVKATIHGFILKGSGSGAEDAAPPSDDSVLGSDSSGAGSDESTVAADSPLPLQVAIDPSGGVNTSVSLGSGRPISTSSSAPGADAASGAVEYLPRGTDKVLLTVVYEDGRATDPVILSGENLQTLPITGTIEQLARGEATLQVRAVDEKDNVLAAARYPLKLWPGRTYEVSASLGVLVEAGEVVPPRLEVPAGCSFFAAVTDRNSHRLVLKDEKNAGPTWTITPKQGARIVLPGGGEWTLASDQGDQGHSFMVEVTGDPAVVSLFPASGVPGSRVMLKGDGFGEAQGGVKVMFADQEAIVTSWSRSQVLCEVPEGLAPGPIQVKMAPSHGSPLTFTVESI